MTSLTDQPLNLFILAANLALILGAVPFLAASTITRAARLLTPGLDTQAQPRTSTATRSTSAPTPIPERLPALPQTPAQYHTAEESVDDTPYEEPRPTENDDLPSEISHGLDHDLDHELQHNLHHVLDDTSPWENKSPEDKVLLEGRAQDLARAALGILETMHAYAFEGVFIEDVGTIDQLVVCPTGLFVVLVQPNDFYIRRTTLNHMYNSYYESGDDLVDPALYNNPGPPILSGALMEPDPDDALISLSANAEDRLGMSIRTARVLILFPNATQVIPHDASDALQDLMDVPPRFIPLGTYNEEDHRRERMYQDYEVDALAAKVHRVFGNSPWITPTTREARERWMGEADEF